MSDMLVIATLLGALSVGVVSPGPSFLMVAQTSMAASRRAGIAAALGMGVAAAVLALTALVGLHAVLASSVLLTKALQAFGGLYLLFLASRIWASASQVLALDAGGAGAARSNGKSFGFALATMLSNPKAAVQYGIIFAALLPRDLSISLSAKVVALVFILESGWYLVVALALSSQAPHSAYLAHKTAVDRTAALVMALLGIRLLIAAAK